MSDDTAVSIPEEVMPVVDVLRRDVKRPEGEWSSGKYNKGYRTRLRENGCCPMGLHPRSTSIGPVEGSQFAGGECEHSSVHRFYKWWDDIKISQVPEALDLIWAKP